MDMWEAHTKNVTFHASISVCYQISLYFTETKTIQTQNTHTLVDMGYLPRMNLHTVQVKHPNLNLRQWIVTFLKRNQSCLSFHSYLYRLQSCWQSMIWAGPFQPLTVIFIAIVSYLFHIKNGAWMKTLWFFEAINKQKETPRHPAAGHWVGSGKTQVLLLGLIPWKSP